MNAALAPTTLDWGEVWQLYHARVYAYIRQHIARTGCTEEQVEDLTGDVFVKAIEATKRGNGPTTHVSGWLFRIAHNVIIDEYRYRHSHGGNVPLESVAEMPQRDLTPFEHACSAIGCETIWHAVGQLTEPQISVVALRVEVGYYNEDAIRATGAARAIHTGRLFRARARLRELFAMKGYRS